MHYFVNVGYWNPEGIISITSRFLFEALFFPDILILLLPIELLFNAEGIAGVLPKFHRPKD
jgi:hypothetical protein